MDVVSLLQVGAAFVLNAGFAWLAGSWCARFWMQSNGASRRSFEPALGKADVLAAALCVIGSALALYAATAVMGGVGMAEAGPLFWTMLSGTDYGQSGSVAGLAMLALALARWMGAAGRLADVGAAAALLTFVLTRASMGHAGEEGFWTPALWAEAIHLGAIGVWTGAVLVSAWFAINDSRIAQLEAGGADRYLELMSHASALAVLAIFATGVYSAWHRVGSGEALFHTFYGAALLVKVGLVLAAIALGAYNKFFGMPAARRSQTGLRAVRTVLRVESVFLLGALLAAAILISQLPPAAV